MSEDNSIPLGKVTEVKKLHELVTWHVDVKLHGKKGTMADTYNRAGIVVDGGAYYAHILSARDMEPIGSHIRLTLDDPLDDERRDMAYDYRAGGSDEYLWRIRINSTGEEESEAVMTFDNINSLPDTYDLILIDPSTGSHQHVKPDMTVNVSLNGETETTYLLKAAAHLDEESIDEENTPEPFGIQVVGPNPFNPSATIRFGLEQPGKVTVKVYNINGQVVETLINDELDAGAHELKFNGKNLATGLYFIELQSGGRRDVRKMTLLK
jgi:hypothetical protein